MVTLKLEWKLISKKRSVLYIYLPVNDGNQTIKNIEMSKIPKNFVREKYFSYAKYLTHGNFNVTAKINANVKRTDKYKEKCNQFFLKKEPGLLMNKTKKFVKDLANAREVYDWVLRNIGRPESIERYLVDLTEDNSVDLKMAVRERKAMCGGKSALFVSMCRNIGIPARVVTGYFMRDGWTWLKDSKFHKKWMDLHVWAEFYEKGWWLPVDCNIAQQTGKDYFGKFPDYTFKNKDRRIVISKGSRFLIDRKVRDSLQTAHFDKASNLKVSLKINA